MKSMKRAVFAILAVVFSFLPAAHAVQEAPSAAASASAAPNASASVAPTGMPVAQYTWPKEASEAPKEEEWAGATELEAIATTAQSGWVKRPARCRQRAVREWVRLECSPPDPPNDLNLDVQRFYGSLWGLAGDISGSSAQFELVSKVEKYSKGRNPAQTSDRLTLGMGAVGMVTFQAKYGSATMLRMDQIFWAERYDGGGNVELAPGIIIDVSWALGEKYPTIALLG